MSDELVFTAHVPRSPVGRIVVWATAKGLRRIEFASGAELARAGERWVVPGAVPDAPDAPAHLSDAVAQLSAYFEGQAPRFDVPLDPQPATPFQQHVWQRLQQIPHGEVISYGELAKAVGAEKGARAVGQAVGANPLPIVIPCHRVVAADGTLHGFSGGLKRKAALLRLEGFHVDSEGPEGRVLRDVLDLGL